MENINYPNPPITEAIIDIQVDSQPQITIDDLQNVRDERYRTVRRRFVYEGELRGGAEVSASATQKHIGFICFTEDEKQAFQARLDGFTFSRLSPYADWSSLRDEAKRLWNIYKTALGVKGVNRIAVRYINRLNLPLPLEDFKEYLLTTPEIGPATSQGLSGFLMRLEAPQLDIDAMLILHEALIPPPSDEMVSILLDIDLFQEASIALENDEQLWLILETLRHRKNQVFEASITDKTRRLFY